MRPTELLVVSAAVFALAASANEHAPKESSHPETKSAKQSSRDVKVPKGLVARIEHDYREFLKAEKVPDKGIQRKLLNLRVELSEKKHAALHEDAHIGTPLGGGVIDLADFVTPVRGAFQMKIRASGEKSDEAVPVKAYFVSRAKTRRIAGEQYGAGCDKYMEITNFFNRKMAGEGFQLYTADQRYVSVLGGTFVLVSFDKDALMVGSVTFQDSRFPELSCE